MRALLVFLVLGIASIGGFANSLVFCSDADKVYISSDQVIVSPEGIIVLAEGEMFQVEAILQDNNGLYYLAPSIYWACRICGYTKNPSWTNYCKECGRRYDDYEDSDE